MEFCDWCGLGGGRRREGTCLRAPVWGDAHRALQTGYIAAASSACRSVQLAIRFRLIVDRIERQTSLRFQRAISKRLRSLSTHFKILVLTGPRQSGKTTLLRELFADYHYVSLDLPQDAALAEESPSVFLRENPRPLVVDEVQYAPKLFRHLKAAVDPSPKKGQIILTGSQRFNLMREVSESLAGRAAIIELHGLNCEELGDVLFDQLDREGLHGLLARGAYPALWEDVSVPTVDFYRSYTATWLERDLRQLLHVGGLREFDRFLRSCAARSGQLLNKSDLARDVGIAPSTAGQWLSVLEAAGLIVILEPWFSNIAKRIVKTPKMYFADTGLLTFLLGLDARALRTYAGLGAVWETYVLGELVRWRDVHHPESTIHYYRDKEGLEVDFLIRAHGETYLVDAKLAEIPDAGSAKNLFAVEMRLGSTARKALAVPATKSFPLGKNVHATSAFRLKAFLEA
ncbi:MAG: ATP-binding protein [Myxococcaceae bacterium]